MICSPDPGLDRRLDFCVRIGIREGAKDEEKSAHRGSDRLCPAPSGERDPGGGDHPKMGIAEQTFYRWKKRFAGMGVAELRRLRQLEDENRRLKRLVADLTLDKQMLQDVLSKSSEARREEGPGGRAEDGLHGLGTAGSFDTGICTLRSAI